MTDPDRPAADELADDHDQDGWVRDVHGLFADYATPDDTVTTLPADQYLTDTGES